ncbi:MAG: hypothetical protein WKG00_18280 [Polyangiaceae bacterium]
MVDMLTAHKASWAAVVLSHPHGDHAAGMVTVLDSMGSGPIGCVAPYVEPPDAWLASDDPARQLAAGEVEAALAAIEYRWRDPAQRWELVSGSTRTLGDARLTVLHPTESDVDEAVKAPPPADPNQLASPLMIEWHAVEIILGSDLPKKGWRKVKLSHPDARLASHHALKIAHHGSDNAVHAVVLQHDSRDRTWILTPFHRGRRLPNFGDGGGVEALHGHNDELILTSLRDPAVTDSPPHVSRQKVRDFRAKTRSRSLGARVRVVPRPGMDPGGWVAVGFDRSGEIQHREYGSGAVIVVNDPSAAAGSKRAKKKRPRGK